MRGGGLLPLCCYRAQAMRKELKGKSIQRQRRCLLSDGCAVAELGPAAATRAPKEKTPYVSDEEEEVEEDEGENGGGRGGRGARMQEAGGGETDLERTVPYSKREPTTGGLRKHT
ncbi:unnamed protein product [Prorocentrum cordatum]|uniref:Uncharacterized protein n=1 Tax=Prorocentrum cordatum TaxID=2364126 RepID=A0ABN9Q6H3_9DINO|nr:unnamed protein product [Polarella glacialis]